MDNRRAFLKKSGSAPKGVLAAALFAGVGLFMLVWNELHFNPAALQLPDETEVSAHLGCSEKELHASANPINDAMEALSVMPKDVEEALNAILSKRNNSRATFVQIGANDGLMNDHLYPLMKDSKERWIALMVEPQPELYSRLCVLHADAPDWAFFLGAVAPSCKNGTISFCETRSPGEGGWQTQGQINKVSNKCDNEKMHYQTRPCISSFSDLIYQHASPMFLKHVLQEEANGTTSKRKFHVDFMQIDVEGNDFKLLKMIDWNALKPTCLRYEQKHLRSQQTPAKEYVQSMGYTFIDQGVDVLACLVKPQ